MAGIYHNYFDVDFVGSDELHYFAIPPEKLPSTFSRQFNNSLVRMGHNEYLNNKKSNETTYFELITTSLAEHWLFSYIKTFNSSITKDEVRCFFRGSKRLPGGDPLDPEEDFWIIEPEKVTNVMRFLDNLDFNKVISFVPDPLYPTDEESQKFHKGYYVGDMLLEPMTFLHSNLKRNNVILCVWDQS